jgi:predicted metal-dependent peptidase
MANIQDSTSLDVNVAPAVSSKANDFKLDPHVLALLWEEPFYANIIRRLTKKSSRQIPTAGVTINHGELLLLWNPDFVSDLESAHIRGLLKHECWHLILGHVGERRKEPHMQWNYATDWAINSNIPGNELPPGGLRPGVPFDPLTPEQLENATPEMLDRYEKLSLFQQGLPPNKSAEWYFSKLNEDKEVSEALEQMQGEPGSGDDGDGESSPGRFDDHASWDDISDEDREMAKGKIRRVLEEAVKEADSSGKGWGSMTSEQRQTIREIVSNEIPWQSVLKQFCGMSRRANRSTNVKRLNRKYPGIHPGAQKGYTSSIAVYVDQSGSVGDDALALLFGELKNLAKHTEFTIFNFDTQVDESSERVWRRGNSPGIARTRCGGTCFKAPTRHANKNSRRFDGYLILSDGEASDPGPTKLKRGWVIVPDCELYFDPSKRDFLIQMKNSVS